MKTSLRTRLIVAYALLALFCVLSVSISANYFLENQFKRYVQDRIVKEQEQTLKTLNDAYQVAQSWNEDELTIIGMNALERGFIIRIQDSFNRPVWDARTHNNGMCQQMLASMARNMDSRYPAWNGSYQEQAFPVDVNGTNVGTAWIGFYGPFYYNDSELFFLTSLNQLLIVAAIILLVTAIGLGWIMARWMSQPIFQVTTAAHSLRLGALDTRIDIRTGIREIIDLSASINSLAQSLGEQEFLRRRMTTDISHELRTPLSSLQGHLEAMIDGIWVADTLRLESCREEVLRLTRLVGQIEGLAKIEADQTIIELKTVNLKHLIEQTCTNFQAEFISKRVELIWVIEDITTLADPDKLTQILVNLLSNALKYTDANGTVQVNARLELARDQSKDSEYINITVKDNGIGIPAADLPHVFERFYRVDSSRTRSTGGAGIGLTIAHSLAQLHGGSITVESVEGAGAAFFVTIPYRSVVA